ncbi:histidine phosphatase family protein [Parageobacillus thermoglucosidasius]|uniref:Phosphatase n=2 Tax=Anoxybacillaceae TaxID=3120669 RepID=A0AAN0YPX0_PARTM|nr:histidine phosphatase family protein [Parageobacillus thermoglucosidasius]KYD16026.1 Phosphoglycerate mutase [Anoxybacillus flavithermus]ALF11160.1 phosphatase [Parageobacillus thermoglucosidasius]ANZ31235.1 phosphatase [Parageobacillus thermoglucosidasius]APM81973.1 phosphatase [Parageobacillus thermoglucosidasius]EID44655.1 phosphoglycerate mutase family protein [Parageobacillus thermoglucosidasius TNO-09.020]
MVTLYLTRHGETEWNVKKRMQGWQDSPLTEKGRQDAVRLGKRLETVDLAAIYTSTSGRALETAQLIRGERLIPVYAEEQLREIHLGDWEGKTHEEIKEMDPIAFDHFWNHPHLYTPRRGERFIDVQNRAFAAIEQIIERHSEGNILIVTHGVVLKTVLARFKNTPLTELWAPPYMYGASVTIVKTDGGKFELLLEGDVSHLEKVKEV